MNHCRSSIAIVLLVFMQHAFSQVVQPDFSLVRGTSTFTLGKVNGIAQDRDGYMWFADQTNRCFARFDGYHIKIYRHDLQDSISTECKDFECIASDTSGNIWSPTPYGIDKFDVATNKFIHYRYPKSEKGSGGDAILRDHNGTVWMGGGGGLCSLDPATGKFTFYLHNDHDTSSLSSNIVRSLYEDKTGVLWVGTGIAFDTQTKEGGLNRFNRTTGTFTRYLHDPNNPLSLISNKVRAMLEDSKGNFWVGTDGDGLHLMNRQNGTFQRLTYDPAHPDKLSRPHVEKGKEFDHITFISEDALGKIWIGTYAAGITCFSPDTKKIEHYINEDKKKLKRFAGDNTWASYISKEGAIWISTEHSDLFRVDPLQTGFSEVKIEGSVNNILEDGSGNLWLSSYDNGLQMINGKTNERKKFVHDPNDSFSITSSNNTGFIQQAADGQLWIGSWNGGNLFDPKTGRFKRYFYNPPSKGQNQDTTGVFGLFETKDEIYFGVFGGLKIQNKNTGAITRYSNDPQDSNSISKGGGLSVLDKGDGNIWMTVFNGENIDSCTLELFDTSTKKFRHYLRGMTNWGIFKSSDGNVWVGTSRGLYHRNDSLDLFLQAGPEGSEFRKARVKSMTEDADKNIWGISTLGIFRFNPNKNELNIYGDKFGVFDVGALPYEETYKSSNGEILFGNPHGYYKCVPHALINPIAPQINITDFKIDGHSLVQGINGPLKDAVEEAKEITLSHRQNIFSIDFAAIHFSDPENNVHQYMLEGYDNIWRDALVEKTAYYFNVPTGNYVFKIKAVSSYGVKSEKSINIIVLPPWWQTWWAYSLYFLFLVFAVWNFIKWRTWALNKEKLTLEKKVADRTLELKNEKEIVEITLAELKSAQNQLVQSEKMASLGELTAGIAHEIQNPLNFVNNFSEVSNELVDEMNTELDKGDIDEAKAIAMDIKQNLEKINHHGKRADAIVKGMLQHSRSSAGVKEPIDLNALTDEYLRLAYHGLRAKDKQFNAEMITDFDQAIGKINIVSQDIGRVILNLINNAFYAVNEKKKATAGTTQKEYEPVVKVSTKKIGNQVSVTVSDNGNGIPQKIVDKIFQPFFTTKPTGQGTGLGLSLSYDIVKANGGEIKVETTEGEGSAFSMVLPV